MKSAFIFALLAAVGYVSPPPRSVVDSRCKVALNRRIGGSARQFTMRNKSRPYVSKPRRFTTNAKVTTYRPVWETEVRERRYTVAKPIYETSEREERFHRAEGAVTRRPSRTAATTWSATSTDDSEREERNHGCSVRCSKLTSKNEPTRFVVGLGNQRA